MGCPGADREQLLQLPGVDYRHVDAPYIGPQLYSCPEGYRVDPLEGCIMRKVENDSGYYRDFAIFP